MIALISDIHFHNWTQFASVLESGRNSRLQDTVDVVLDLKRICDERNIEHVVCTGDVFHSRTKIDIDVYDAAWQSLKALADGRKLHILLGNHDTHNRQADVHSLEPFKDFAHVIDSPERFMMRGAGYEYTAVGIPWIHEPEDFRAVIAEQHSADLLFLHQALVGAELSSGLKTVGDILYADLPIEKFRAIFMGDFHKPQFIEPNVWYVGSPMQHNFGETKEEKRFLLWSQENGVESIPTKAPKFWAFNNPNEFVESKVDAAKDFVRVMYDGECLDAMAALAEQYPKINAVPNTKESQLLVRSDACVVDSDFELVQEYIKMRCADESDDYQNELSVCGMELLNAE